jgi:hypothetical protein
MTAIQLKRELHSIIENMDDIKLLKALKQLLQNQSKTIVDKNELHPFSMEQFNDRIDQSMHDSAMNKVTENSELEMEIQKWQ